MASPPKVMSSDRESRVLRWASRPRGLTIPNKRGWRAWLADDLLSRGLLSRAVLLDGRFQFRITIDGLKHLDTL